VSGKKEKEVGKNWGEERRWSSARPRVMAGSAPANRLKRSAKAQKKRKRKKEGGVTTPATKRGSDHVITQARGERGVGGMKKLAR